MKDIMIATSNKGKVREYKSLLEPLGYIVHDLSELDPIEIDENGSTFQENALIKAKSIQGKCNMTVIADDSGLEIDALNKEPGIHSARYLEGHDYSYKNKVLLERMKGKTDRTARFVCAIALCDETGDHLFTGVMEGKINDQAAGDNGFGYDPIFLVEQFGKTSAQLTMEQKNSVSHRGIATRELLAYLKGEK
ncbi:MAG: RdgB/HAM1 family non-canonical purine NTP pyrophosphatase [Erysipelotrichaceae bacterium]|nr:RdgB/HAM1 family non-canonical purine NTP pyrophosphatase [Erysipelotrichaceae bacterium]MDY5727337.1 RdgB/HAM1 family non-canonical purine NTP pyrophosphatase [Erysipelotrichaceae bacterium]